MVPVEDNLPFRRDLVTPDQLGSLLDGAVPPDLWFLDDLVACAGKVLACSGNGNLSFVGRSLDSMFDLLGGTFAGPHLVAFDEDTHETLTAALHDGTIA